MEFSIFDSVLFLSKFFFLKKKKKDELFDFRRSPIDKRRRFNVDSIKSKSFDVKGDDFCLLKIWIYELLLINIKQRSVQQSTVSAHEVPYEFLRILSIFRGKFIVLVLRLLLLISREWNSVVTIWSEARLLRNITGWDYLLGNWFKIKFPEILLYCYMSVFP